jgi:hypothetical protein
VNFSLLAGFHVSLGLDGALGTCQNHKVTNLENMEPAEAQECTFAPEIHEMTMLYVGMS